MSIPIDAAARARALLPERSFIVQAPAGSGKTGLLIQRHLALLATVENPEEVIAITFTRKATGEMRERVIEALAAARDGPQPGAPHERTTWVLARAVVERDAALGWDLAAQPGRLRILTIDALCGWLARNLALRSGLAEHGRVADDAGALYAEAATQILELLDDRGPWGQALATLLSHLDNDVARLRGLLVRMLAGRDQWLRFLGGADDAGGARRQQLEAALERVCRDRLAAARAAVPEEHAGELVSVCAFAGEQLAERAPDHPGAACAGLDALPAAEPAALARWRGVAAVLQTSAGDWRRAFNVANGFPPRDQTSAAMKLRALALVEVLGTNTLAAGRIAAARALPEPSYAEADWRILEALLDVLRVAAATLKMVFAERSELDHAEIAGAARLALGAEGEPSDLALSLDHRIGHLLVDEFQDTSHGQYELLASLTAGWSHGDGRTLFLVGDPMQSIYRFREADVGLFEHARLAGIGDVVLESLVLEANFRSRPAVVERLNALFPAVLGTRDDATTGAVAHRPSVAMRAPTPGVGVSVRLLPADADDAELDAVVSLAGDALARHPSASVAVLVRARTHLAALLPRLRAAGIAYRGVEIEPLAEVPAVRDLLSLARVALAPLDRVAWLAVLRAPWCGLGLDDLLALVDGAGDAPVPALMVDPERLTRLTPQGAARLARVHPVLENLVAGARRGRVARRLEAAWQALGGPACVDAAGLAAAERCLALMHELGDALLAGGPGDLAAAAARLFAEPEATRGAVEVMTMHRAKGLEFDTVIVPGLGRAPRASDRELLEWTSRAAGPGAADILLAPIPAAGEREPVLYDFVRTLEREKDAHEAARVLYVAATRARESLHLVGSLALRDDGTIVDPPARSLLGLLWPALGDAERRVEEVAPRPQAQPSGGATYPRRLPVGWVSPERPAAIADDAGAALPAHDHQGEPIEFDWAGRLARDVGTVVHAALGQIAEDGAAAWSAQRLHSLRAGWAAELRARGIAASEVAQGVGRIDVALQRVIGDARARWLLDPGHRAAASELALAGVVDGVVVRGVVDRTFVDPSGLRWIVDYKTGRHEGGDIERFLDREQERYRAQLERYAALLGAISPGPSRVALYFPVSGGWREWTPAVAG